MHDLKHTVRHAFHSHRGTGHSARFLSRPDEKTKQSAEPVKQRSNEMSMLNHTLTEECLAGNPATDSGAKMRGERKLLQAAAPQPPNGDHVYVSIALCSTTYCSHSSVFQQLFAPTALCSNNSVLPQLFVPTALYSNSSLHLQLCVPTALCSHGSVFQQLLHLHLCVPTTLCFHSYVFPRLRQRAVGT